MALVALALMLAIRDGRVFVFPAPPATVSIAVPTNVRRTLKRSQEIRHRGGRSGQTREATFNFKVDGTKLTDTMTVREGDVAIAGTVSEDTLTFSVETQRGKQTYSGKISDNEIQFKRDTGQGAAQEFTAKRAN